MTEVFGIYLTQGGGGIGKSLGTENVSLSSQGYCKVNVYISYDGTSIGFARTLCVQNCAT